MQNGKNWRQIVSKIEKEERKNETKDREKDHQNKIKENVGLNRKVWVDRMKLGGMKNAMK